MSADCPDLQRFLRGEVAASTLPHREHVRMAFEVLRRHDFAECVWQFSRALRAMAAKAGRPEAFNQTITIAFLSLIAERMESAPGDFAAFERANADLLDKEALARWYPPGRLASASARRIFLLPEPYAAGNAARPAAEAAATTAR